METVTIIIGLIGLLGIWWLGSSLSWLSKQDDIRIQNHGEIVRNFRENKHQRQRQVHRKGFGKNHFKEKALKQRIESDIDKVIREAEKAFNDKQDQGKEVTQQV